MIISGVFDLAVADGVRRDNPARSPCRRPGRPVRRARPHGWDAAGVRAVARGCREYETVPLVIAGLGLRECEGFGLPRKYPPAREHCAQFKITEL
jgi:hypothetical protein